MIRFDFTADFDAAEQAVRDLAAKQIPFAEARALTQVAKDVQESMKRGILRRFTVRRKNIVHLVRIRPARKRDSPPTAEVRMIGEFWKLQEEGGIKRPRGRLLSIPSEVTRTKTGRVRKSGAKRRKRFIRRIGGQLGVWQRKGKDRFPVRLLFVLEPIARVKPRLGLAKTGAAVAATAWPRRFGESFRDALRSAK